MSFASKEGLENVLTSLRHVLSGQLPGVVSAYNAAHSAELRSYLSGSYAFGTSKTLDLYLNNGSLTTLTLTGTMTAAQTVTALNAALPATMIASVFMGSYVQIAVVAKGSACSIKLGAGSANAIFGWIDGSIVNHLPLRAPAWYGIAYENLEGMATSYPACILRGIDATLDDNLQLVSYSVMMRIREVCSTPDFGDTLYLNLANLAERVADVLHDSANANLLGQVNVVHIDNIKPATSIEMTDAGMIGAYIDFTISLIVQEE